MLPIVLVGLKHGILSWDLKTYHIEKIFESQYVWSISCTAGTNIVVLGCEKSSMIVEVDSEKPIIMSMDVNGGKFIWAEQLQMKQSDLNEIESKEDVKIECLTVAAKNIGSSNIHPEKLAYSPDGKFVAVCGCGKYEVYNLAKTKLSMKTSGTAQEFVWGKNRYEFAIRLQNGILKLYRDFKKLQFFSPENDKIVEKIFGCHLLGLKTSVGLSFYDWESRKLVQNIDVQAK